MSRHKSLSSAMSALMAYRNRPEGEIVPVATNWSTIADNDNADLGEVGGYGVERGLRVRPTIQRIMHQVKVGDVERNDNGQVIRIGDLRFSDGQQVERGYKIGPDGGAVGTELRMPAGAMLGASEEMERTISGGENPAEIAESNHYFADMFGVARRQRRPQRKREKRTTPAITHADAKAMLAQAYANTPVLPPVTKCPPGLPSAGGKIADSFVGMQTIATGDTGATGWQDACSALVSREIWHEALAQLSERDRTALDAVAHGRARNYADVGVGLGQQSEYARRKGGKRAITAANDNLGAILKKVAA